MKWIGVAFGLLWAGGAMAQVNIYPPFLSGQGVMTATGTSAAISTANVTATGASSAFPVKLPGGFLTVKVEGSQTASVSVCWLGGTCTFATGEQIAPGESVTRTLTSTFGSTPATVITSGGSVLISVEY